MVRDGLYYAIGFLAGAAVVTYMTNAWYGFPLMLLGLFCAWFFRDPDRLIPAGPVAVSPADGKVVAVVAEGQGLTRISIFLNIFDVHVNRAPISGTLTEVKYQKGLFLVASKGEASAQNEQTQITIQGQETRVVFKQIAGLIARRIVISKKPGDYVDAGERVGMIKFGSRCDVILGPEWMLEVSEGDRVMAGTSVLARRGGVAEVIAVRHAPIKDELLCTT